jgi:hypothetical protein
MDISDFFSGNLILQRDLIWVFYKIVAIEIPGAES